MDPKSTSGEELLRRAKSEFVEMPGLRLTEPQARRLWGLDQASCSRLLDTLVNARFLSRTRDGAFLRTDTNGTRNAAARSRSTGPK
jgi:DNA-binding IclR family transcriptional regulator